MKDFKILLVCSGGMSTSILMKKMEAYAKEHDFNLEIEAVGMGVYKDIAANYDIMLLGPQIAYRKKSIEETVDMPVVAIAPQDYAFGNSEKIFKQVEAVLGE